MKNYYRKLLKLLSEFRLGNGKSSAQLQMCFGKETKNEITRELRRVKKLQWMYWQICLSFQFCTLQHELSGDFCGDWKSLQIAKLRYSFAPSPATPCDLEILHRNCLEFSQNLWISSHHEVSLHNLLTAVYALHYSNPEKRDFQTRFYDLLMSSLINDGTWTKCKLSFQRSLRRFNLSFQMKGLGFLNRWQKLNLGNLIFMKVHQLFKYLEPVSFIQVVRVWKLQTLLLMSKKIYRTSLKPPKSNPAPAPSNSIP